MGVVIGRGMMASVEGVVVIIVVIIVESMGMMRVIGVDYMVENAASFVRMWRRSWRVGRGGACSGER